MINFKIVKSKIEKQREVIIARIKRLRKDDPFSTTDRALIVEPGTDAAQLYGHEQAVVLENQLKMKKKTYGICERCGKKIDLARLQVKPQAIYCVKCLKEIETKKG